MSSRRTKCCNYASMARAYQRASPGEAVAKAREALAYIASSSPSFVHLSTTWTLAFRWPEGAGTLQLTSLWLGLAEQHQISAGFWLLKAAASWSCHIVAASRLRLPALFSPCCAHVSCVRLARRRSRPGAVAEQDATGLCARCSGGVLALLQAAGRRARACPCRRRMRRQCGGGCLVRSLVNLV